MSRQPPYNLALPLDAFQNFLMPSSPTSATATPIDFLSALSCFSDPELGNTSSSERHALNNKGRNSQQSPSFPLQTATSRQPNSMRHGFPYTFDAGDKAWALGLNGKWRQVTVLKFDFDFIDGVLHQMYLATWIHQGLTYRGRFSPTDGEIKPDTEDVRKMMERERVVVMDADDSPLLV